MLITVRRWKRVWTLFGRGRNREGSFGKIQQVETVSTLPEKEWRVSEKAKAEVSEEDGAAWLGRIDEQKRKKPSSLLSSVFMLRSQIDSMLTSAGYCVHCSSRFRDTSLHSKPAENWLLHILLWPAPYTIARPPSHTYTYKHTQKHEKGNKF